MEKNNYSKLLQNLLKIMLSDINDRPLPSQILDIFKPYKRKIMQFRPFNLHSLFILWENVHKSKVLNI
jgi:hypothetical protein